MGGIESRIPEKVDLKTFQELAGFAGCEEIFDTYKNNEGYITKEKALELAASTDWYLSSLCRLFC